MVPPDVPILIVLQVFEKLGSSLYDFLKENDYRPFSIDLIRDFGRQLLASVACELCTCSFPSVSHKFYCILTCAIN